MASAAAFNELRGGAQALTLPGRWLGYGAVVLIACLGMALQLSAYINHDVAWVLWGAREMLDGAKFGRDIIEPNPPLAWYLSMPSTWAARMLDLPIAAAFQLAIGLSAFGSVLVFHRFAARLLVPRFQFLPTIVAATFLFVLIGRDFGQREHILVIAVLPYLALAGARCSGSVVSKRAAAAIGIVAAFGLALKPYFIAAPLFLETAGILLTRRWSFPLRTENFVIAIFLAVYAAFIALFCGDYLRVSVPLASAIYWSFDLPLATVVRPLTLPLLAAVFAAVAARRKPLPLVLAVATGGLAVACLVQHKGYPYHVYPVVTGSALALASMVATRDLAARQRGVAALLLLTVTIQPIVNALTWWNLNSPSGMRTVQVRRLLALLDDSRADRFLVVAVHPFPAFPTALYSEAHYISRTNSQWFLPAVVQSRMRRRPDPKVEQLAREFALRDLSQGPDVVIVDTDSTRHTRSIGDFDFVAFYAEDPQLRLAWSHYREAGRLATYRIFVRA